MKDEAGQQQAPHDGQQTFKDCDTLILIEIPFVPFGGGEGGLTYEPAVPPLARVPSKSRIE